MSTQSEVMHCYEQIAPLTERMLVLARSSQWAGLPALEAQFSEMVDHLQHLENPQSRPAELDAAQRARKLALLRRIHDNHDELCGLVRPQLAHLYEVIKSLERQGDLHRVYQQGGHSLQ